ncbi:NAD(P)H-dependent oxidoreductase [Actinokineospora auranticolor]|uniref:NAD(P)H-dependent FMN reductase n=1 Tax=Actinokineospora auranticolor TaxID=155976 RepID=A0A2S6GC36_9PSEU|nr:NAD(P)H-dependent oxidoreductase [Actinokineospora auranticolor]PPK62039.1 NAD(P)H-dependent FMN reductase [Actinokineospora auranticolor]
MSVAPSAVSAPIRVAVIIGSVRKGRFGPTVAGWFVTQVARHPGVEVDLIDLIDYDLPAALTDSPSPEIGAKLGELDPRLTAADAFVVVTPEYNHSVPASLKSFIDWHFVQWQAKPVALISYGGMAGGLRAVEHLRHIFAELHAMTIRDSLSFHNFHAQFDAQGQLIEPAGAEAAADTLVNQLGWWARALREARDKHPYGA